jgi:hypothetical protein
LKEAKKLVAKAGEKLAKRLNGHANGAKLNGKLLNGHGEKSAAGKMIAEKSDISVQARETQSGESLASA